MLQHNNPSDKFCFMNALRLASLVLIASLLLTALFWGPLWLGYGFVGGDLYPYFFPQKTFLAERLHASEFPLWNNLTGLGYPILGESQTGAAYPPYLIAYYFLDANSAYNVQHLLHYVICFGGTWLLGRRLGMGLFGSLLTAVVFTYGWFPPRACLEWAIVTGAWLPVAIWCVESFLQTRWWRYAIGLSVVLGMQLLAGHFHLAFITQLVVAAWSGWRLLIAQDSVPLLDRSGTSSAIADKNVEKQVASTSAKILSIPIALSIIAGFLLASIQLVPAWELKTRSSRASVGGEHEPSYGHMPPLYVSQMVAPFLWYSPLEIDGNETIRTIAEFGAPWHWFGPHDNLDELLMTSRAGGLNTIATNRVEAHLYCGLVPFGLAIWWLIIGHRSAPSSVRVRYRYEMLFWGIAGTLAVIYATGWLLPVARHIPGFNFFRGPGRYGIVTTLAIAIFAGRGLDSLLTPRVTIGRAILLGCVFWSTIGDLWLVSRMVRYSVMVAHPPVTLRDQSPVRKILLAENQIPRLYAPGQNLCNLLGVSCVPVYLGIAPQEYSDPRFGGAGMPKVDEQSGSIPGDEQFNMWLRANGVTHVLSFAPLDEQSWNSTPVWQGIDPMLNSAWGRPEPIYLSKLKDPPARASLIQDQDQQVPDAFTNVTPQIEANRVAVQSESSLGGILELQDLNYPGWQVDIDGRPANSYSRGVFRQVEVPPGSHTVTWTYRPFSVKLGLTLTLATAFLLAAIAHVRFWHPARLDAILSKLSKRHDTD